MRKKGRLFLRRFRLVIVSISLAFCNIPLRCRTRLSSITSRWNVAAVTILTTPLRFWRWKVRGSFLMMQSYIANCCAGTARCNRYGGTHSCSQTVANGRTRKRRCPYYLCAQRLYCGEGESLLADLRAYRESYPSTQADNLLLQWSKRHCPDYFALLVMVIEARSMEMRKVNR